MLPHSASTVLKRPATTQISFGGEVAYGFLYMSSTWPKMISGNFKAEENAIEVDNDSAFNSHKHYSVGSQTIGSKLYLFCLLDVLWESSTALSYMSQMNFLTQKNFLILFHTKNTEQAEIP